MCWNGCRQQPALGPDHHNRTLCGLRCNACETVRCWRMWKMSVDFGEIVVGAAGTAMVAASVVLPELRCACSGLQGSGLQDSATWPLGLVLHSDLLAFSSSA